MRNCKMDNIKALLIFLVVFGHLLELDLDYGINRLLFFIVYSFHMPMFVYMSGYFASFQWKRLLKKIIWPYVLFQTIYILFENNLLGNDLQMQWSKPYWILWYLFAMAIWLSSLLIISKMNKKNRIILFFIAIIAAVAAGYCNGIGREYSMSRVLVFYPFFLWGYYERNLTKSDAEWDAEWDAESDAKWIKNICMGILGVSFLYIFFHYAEMRTFWMYEAASYNKDRVTSIYRIAHMLVAYSWIFLLKNEITEKYNSQIARIGQNTMSIYLMHGFAVKWMDKYELIQKTPYKLGTIILVTVFLVFLFSTNFFSDLLQFLLWREKGDKQK